MIHVNENRDKILPRLLAHFQNRIKSTQELEDRIYRYFDEINAEPVVYHWGWNLDDVDPNEDVKVQTLVS